MREFHPEEGWGVIDAEECPGGCWVHFSVIDMEGYRSFVPGDRVGFSVGTATVDGFDFVADYAVRAHRCPSMSG